MMNEKLERIAKLDDDIRIMENAARDTEKTLRLLREEREKEADAVVTEMQETGCLQAEAGGFIWGLRHNPPKAKVLQEDLIPSWFWLIKKELNKKKLNEALKMGEDVAGVVIDNGSVSLVCRSGNK